MLGGYGMYGYGYGYRLDPTIFLVLIGVLLSLWAQNRVNSTFARYSRVELFRHDRSGSSQAAFKCPGDL